MYNYPRLLIHILEGEAPEMMSRLSSLNWLHSPRQGVFLPLSEVAPCPPPLTHQRLTHPSQGSVPHQMLKSSSALQRSAVLMETVRTSSQPRFSSLQNVYIIAAVPVAWMSSNFRPTQGGKDHRIGGIRIKPRIAPVQRSHLARSCKLVNRASRAPDDPAI